MGVTVMAARGRAVRRFISYSKAGRDNDGTELLGWAGWDHLAQAQALVTVPPWRCTRTADLTVVDEASRANLETN
ncbi:DUF7008 domain-containing protein [Micromonospora sp. NPDC020750]|uniref:DUF7008 domain-containing protein n=1 Tax=unclassified Micromonospora TaxID=2617518 RepID=UPI0037BB948A